MKHHNQELITLQRTSSCSTRTTKSKIIPSNYMLRSSSTPSSNIPIPEHEHISDKLLVRRDSRSPPVSLQPLTKLHSRFSSLLRSLFKIVTFPNLIIPTCKWLSLPTHLSITPSLGRKVTGTLFGHRRGHVSFAVQENPKSEPVLLLELAMSTSMLVKEMSSGLVRIALECDKVSVSGSGQAVRSGKLFNEPMWTMYCNGKKCGYVVSRACTELDLHVLSTVQSVSVGAGVIPMVEDDRKRSESEGELLYMRAKFERVVGSRDSEAFYMMNPDGNGGPELSIFLLRL